MATLVRWEPFRELAALQNEMKDNITEVATTTLGVAGLAGFGRVAAGAGASSMFQRLGRHE